MQLKGRKPKIDDSGLVRLPFPAEIAIETHSYCNFRCIICPYSAMKRPKGIMSKKLLHKIIDEVAKESPDTRLWFAIMGEPLMDKNIISHLKYAKENGAHRLHLNTNGTFLEEQIAKDLADIEVESVYIAIDALSPEIFDKVRPGGDFQRIMRNVENFIKLRNEHPTCNTEIVVQFIVMDENSHEVESFHHYWSKKGVVVKIRLRQGWGVNVDAPDLKNAKIDRFPCPWLIRTMNVHWTGKVTQCDVDFEEEYSAGDINHQTIKDIWDSELSKRRERHWNYDFEHSLCLNCQDWAAGRAEFLYPNAESKKNAPRWSIGEKTN
ncbi:MAG: radical SAM protein [Proteobacteria bacterium]|nr:radical SAM protein [Pseudomonadota bacterium]MBU1582680.1 radical SAM protein [Pseudomonadota bacterium]MBU2631468.1 radical SAM protein [Pseudomonadota bacterium]